MKTLREAKRSDFKRINSNITVLNCDLEEVETIRRFIQTEDYCAVITIRYNNQRHRVMHYGKPVIILPKGYEPRHLKHSKKGVMSAACKGARY